MKYANGNGCYKFYFPLSGEAELKIDDVNYQVLAKNACFINGYKLKEQLCDDYMEVLWVHFVPSSPIINHCLAKSPVFFKWDFADIPFSIKDFDFIPTLFEHPSSEENKPSIRAGIDVRCRVTSIILYLISDMFSRCSIMFEDEYYKDFERLRPAIDYMNAHYCENINLNSIAKCVSLDPSYFLRLFKKNFNATPFEYITSRRMGMAWELVTMSELSICEISEKLGYCSQFHFSYMFKKYFGTSPIRLRSKKCVP